VKRGSSGFNFLLAVDKPVGITSHDVVSHIRRVMGEKRVGHAGTLDPLASGVMVCGIGQATRLMGLITQEQKSYVATICFGAQTSTDDAEGEVIAQAPVPSRLRDSAYATQVMKGIVGPQEQIPPAFSAISVDGKRAYARARAGETVELAARSINILSAEILSIDVNEDGSLIWVCAFCVSKGTYIRSIARDLGLSQKTCAHLTGLKRVASGDIRLNSCLDMTELDHMAAASVAEHALDPTAVLKLPVRELTAQELQDAACGKHFKLGLSIRNGGAQAQVEVELEDGGKVALVHEAKLFGIWRRQGSALVCDTNFPQGIMGVK
jgi:tRNA pseudouridine55 synthase